MSTAPFLVMPGGLSPPCASSHPEQNEELCERQGERGCQEKEGEKEQKGERAGRWNPELIPNYLDSKQS